MNVLANAVRFEIVDILAEAVDQKFYCTPKYLVVSLYCRRAHSWSGWKAMAIRPADALGNLTIWPQPFYESQRFGKLLPNHDRCCSLVDQIITSREKWILGSNYGKTRTWLKPHDAAQQSRASRHDLSFLLCIFWTSAGRRLVYIAANWLRFLVSIVPTTTGQLKV